MATLTCLYAFAGNCSKACFFASQTPEGSVSYMAYLFFCHVVFNDNLGAVKKLHAKMLRICLNHENQGEYMKGLFILFR